MNDIEKMIDKAYKEAIESSKDFSCFDGLAEFCLTTLRYGEYGKNYINALETELLKRQFIKNKIYTWEDFIDNRKRINAFDRMLFYMLRAKGYTCKTIKKEIQ